MIEGGKVYFVGAGPGAPDLITVRGRRILRAADLVLYAASLVSEDLIKEAKPQARILQSSDLHLEQIVAVMVEAAQSGQVVIRLHSGDPTVYGAILEQMAFLRKASIPFEIVPGVSSAFAAAAMAEVELTVPGMSQTVILTRTGGRASPVPLGAELSQLARHPATLAIFLSAALTGEVVRELRAAGLGDDTPVVVAVRATWPDERMARTTLGGLAQTMRMLKAGRQAMILVGSAMDPDLITDGPPTSRLYEKTYTHLFRRGT